MSSTYTLYPPFVPDGSPARRDRMNEPRSLPSNDSQPQLSPSTPVANTHLSAFSPQLRLRSSSSSPNLNSHTPAESTTLSIHYQSSEFSDTDDPFFGINFNTIEGASPDFLDDDFFRSAEARVKDSSVSQTQSDAAHDAPQGPAYLPLSPDRTPSLHTPSPNSERKGDRSTFQSRVAAHGLAHIATQPSDVAQQAYQYTPENSGSGRSSEDGLAPAATATMMAAQSPRLTVSMWTRDGAGVPYPLDTDHNLSTFNDISDDGSYDPAEVPAGNPAARDNQGRWVPDQATGQSGLGPGNRPSTEGPSMNELAAKRKVDERNEQVIDWVAATTPVDEVDPFNDRPPQPADVAIDTIPDREIDMAAETENVPVSGQTYFTGKGGELTNEDVDLMRRNRNWEAAPLPFEISRQRYQPETSEEAIRKFNRMCQDNESVVSMAATWGTRRRSLPMIDVEGITSGSFLKKLTIRGEPGGRRPSLLQELRGLVRKPSNTLAKRPRGEEGDTGSIETSSSADRGSAQPNLGPPSRQLSWPKKQPVPSINTAFVAMGNSVASIATTHARSGSISATPTITSPTPKSPGAFGLTVKRPLSRIRSKSDVKGQGSSLADMWKKSGGPPVASLANPTAVAGDADDEDEEEDETPEDAEMRSEANKMIDDITPNFAGFQQHILKLNPMLANQNTYLVDRIAHQQIVRYKSLLGARVKHLQCTAAKNCPCGTLCIALGGSANVLDSKGDARGMDPLSARYDSDGDITPLEGPGVITQESFPQDIPMPPATILPAEFECQLCFQAKKFQKPSDWTKHVHEDVQPFTCTWDRCRDPKIFKRKADWVRHENEGHRHLEWWDCDVEDCRHVCYRRDNFLQHLVREHKYPEPKVKTKAAIKRAGGLDPTWQKVEQCHKETQAVPYNEPCRFCGKQFPTWKKLTVHLAKHMEQISLPILKLVARKELEADTIISPVQDPPPRPFAASFPVKPEPQQFEMSPTNPQIVHPMGYPASLPQQQPQQQAMMYGIVPPNYRQAQGVYGAAGFSSIPQNMGQPQLSVQPPPNHAVNTFPNLNMQAYPGGLPVTTAGTYNMGGTYMVSPDDQFGALSVNALGLQDPNAAAVYNGMMDPNSAVTQQQHYTPQGSVSPYAHSPHQGPGGFYGQ